MSIENKPEIEIIPWVYFNTPEAKASVIALSETSESIMDLAGKVKATFKLSLNEATIVAKKFYKK